MPDFLTALFYFFAAVIAYAGVRVISARNPVHAALHLMLVFFACAGVWLLMQAEFLALVLVLVYVGAVMILILFVVMMLDLEQSYLSARLKRDYWFALPIGVVLVADLSIVFYQLFVATPPTRAPELLAQIGTTQQLGLSLFREYAFAVEVAALILLVALIAAVALTLRTRKDAIMLRVSEQLTATKDSRLRLTNPNADTVSPTANRSDETPSVNT